MLTITEIQKYRSLALEYYDKAGIILTNYEKEKIEVALTVFIYMFLIILF